MGRVKKIGPTSNSALAKTIYSVSVAAADPNLMLWKLIYILISGLVAHDSSKPVDDEEDDGDDDDDDDAVVTAAARDIEPEEVTQRHVLLNCRVTTSLIHCVHVQFVCLCLMDNSWNYRLFSCFSDVFVLVICTVLFLLHCCNVHL